MTEVIGAPTTQATVEETPTEKIARLEAALAKAHQGNLTRPVQLAEGEVTVESLTRDLRAYNEEQALLAEQNRRWFADYATRNPVPYATESGQLEWRTRTAVEKPLYGTQEAAQEFIGLNKWNSFTKAQKAQLRTITASDLAKLNPVDYFGKDTGRKAAELMASNPGLYAALKAKAKRDGVI
jgi:hypothetical protein